LKRCATPTRLLPPRPWCWRPSPRPNRSKICPLKKPPPRHAQEAAAESAAPVPRKRLPQAHGAGTADHGHAALRQAANASIRVRSQLLDRMVNQAGEVMITRSRLEAELSQLRGSLNDMSGNLNRLRQQLRDIELQAETQMQSRLAQAKEAQAGFDPLEFDRFTRVQELTRMMAESVNDVATVQRTLQRTVEATEDDLIAQARQTRELQRDLLRTRMVEFEGISERLYRVVRQASKETGKQVKLDLLGGTIEMDRGMLDRMTPAFEHLLRNCVAHGIESTEVRTNAGKDPVGLITVHLRQEGNDVSVDFSDDGAGLDLRRIREKAISLGMITPDQALNDSDAANLIFMPGFSTAAQVTELAGRGIGMDVVRSEVNSLGGRIETSTVTGKGTHFKLVLPLTTAVTQVVMIRSGNLSVGVPANVVETVRRASAKELQQAYNTGTLDVAGESIPFFWSGALLQASHHSGEAQGKTTPVVIFRSAAQRIALHVDEVLGNQEVVVKNLGPQLSRLPGLAGMSVLASGAVVLIYNPVALASVYGQQARAWSSTAPSRMCSKAPAPQRQAARESALAPAAPQIPLILVVDDSITVRRVTQRLLQREGYRVSMAADGLQALERLQEERPAVVLSDIEMPRMDGFDLARNIRGDVRLNNLPIIMITSRIAEKHREHAKELGVDHYLGKPFSEEELMSLVRHYCAAETAISA
jgi:chemosensory pili system protein ChpA (sensor histidine kinase/response regulator)